MPLGAIGTYHLFAGWHLKVGRPCAHYGPVVDNDAVMTYSLACGDVMPGCAATFEADTEDDLLAQVVPHAAEAHEITELSPDVIDTVKAAVKQT